MKYFWQISNSTAALYGAAVVGLSAVLMHLWQGSLSTEAVARVISALAMLAFHALALLYRYRFGNVWKPIPATKLLCLK